MSYNEGIWSFVLNTHNFAKLSEPTFKIIFGSVLSIAFDIDLRVADSCRHVETLINIKY